MARRTLIFEDRDLYREVIEELAQHSEFIFIVGKNTCRVMTQKEFAKEYPALNKDDAD